MSVPQVYAAINAITAQLATSGIPKAHRNEVDEYDYRSIDDLLNRLSPLLAEHKLCILPRALERVSDRQAGEGDELLTSVCLRVAFDLVSVGDGSTHVVEAYGEALDPSDKATAKAMTAAYKSAMFQAFCVPVPQEDPDARSPRPARDNHQPAPVEGWEQWTAGIIDIIDSCESEEALERLRERHRQLLKSVSRERPELYARIGEAFSKRTADLARPAPKSARKSPKRVLNGRSRSKSPPEPEAQPHDSTQIAETA